MSTPGSGAVGTGVKNLGTTAGTYTNNQNAAQNQGAGIVNSEVNTSGGLSPLVGKQLASQQGLAGKNFQNNAAAAQRGLAARGMGAAPTGQSASIANTATQNAGQADTQLAGNAFGTQNQLNQNALGYLQGQQQIYNPVAANSALIQGGATQGQMGSTFGNVLGGLSNLGSSAVNAYSKLYPGS
jgi:hypothetical protein